MLRYSGQPWLDLDGRRSRLRCLIERVKECPKLAILAELRPARGVFPRGNVGTTDDQFRRLIKLCQLPSSVIKKLKLDLTPKRRKGRYQSVTMKYNDNIHYPKIKEKTIFTRNGHIAIDPEGDHEIEDNDQLDEKQKDKMEVAEESDPEDDHNMEGWEIHQAFNDDASLARRNHTLTEENINWSAGTKERAFESEIELTWEKGGSGLVFYTDQVYWKALADDGDIFDEEGFNQWGQDNSVFYDKHAGDKDSRDFVQMREEATQRNVQSLVDGFGGVQLTKQGWRRGSSLTKNGLKEPIIVPFRHPAQRTGLGYYGEKLTHRSRTNRIEKHRESRLVKITTVLDQVSKNADNVYRRSAQHELKYRSNAEMIANGSIPARSNNDVVTSISAKFCPVTPRISFLSGGLLTPKKGF